jgi:hypothetical protein
MGAVTSKEMGDGQLPAVKGTLGTVPASKAWIVKSVTFVNTGAVTRTVNLYAKPSGSSSRRIIPKDLSLDAGDCYYETGLSVVLEAGGLIEGDASAAAEVDYMIGGGEETV